MGDYFSSNKIDTMKQILAFFCLFLTLQLSAQTFTNYTTDDGLINNTVNCLAIDANDHIWFGTQEGISFFDGTTWTNYDVDSTPELVSNTITAIAVDGNNNVWVGTDFGVNHFDGTTWTAYTDDDGLADNRVKYIQVGSDGKVWFANNDGISILDGENWTSYVRDDGLPFGGTNFVTFDTEGNTWLGTPLGGIYIFDGENFTTITEEEGLLNDRVRSIAIDGNQHKWIATSDGISVFDENNQFVTHHETIFILPPPDELNPIEDVAIDSKGRIWAAVYVDYLVTVGGISVFDGENWQDFDATEGLAGPVVRRVAIDSEDNAWVVTSTGISKVSDLLTNIDVDKVVDAAIQLHPNPAVNSLFVSVPSELAEANYRLMNAIGAMVLEGKMNGRNVTLEVRNLESGMYFLVLEEGYVRKVLVD